MSKLSFRARALDASKPLPVYRDIEIPDTADCSLINRTVPQMPTGMEKEEESEHHLQQAICTGMTIPTPEVFTIEDLAMYDQMYPPNYRIPRQLIYMQPYSMDADIPDYDMDSEDEQWVLGQASKLELTPDKFEEMMDRLEKGSGQTVVTLQEAKALIKEDDDLIIAVYDYWLTKRLKTQHHLIPQVRTEARHGISNHNPYIAFRRRTEKMQTRKNRKNDETSYEKMLKLRRDLSRAVTLLDMVKRREKSKREILHLSIEVFEKRYQAGDYSGNFIQEMLAQRFQRPAFTPISQGNQLPWVKDPALLATLTPAVTKKEKRQYKKRRHKSASKALAIIGSGTGIDVTVAGQGLEFPDGEHSSDSEVITPPSEADEEDEGPFPFRRRLNCLYNLATDPIRSPPRCSNAGDWTGDNSSFFPASSVFDGKSRYIGSARRRIGRGGRMVLDRKPTMAEEHLASLGYSVYNSYQAGSFYQSACEYNGLAQMSPTCDPQVLHITSVLGDRTSAYAERDIADAESVSDDAESPDFEALTPMRVNESEPLCPFPLESLLGVVTLEDDEAMLFETDDLLLDFQHPFSDNSESEIIPEENKITVKPLPVSTILIGEPDESAPIETTLLDTASAHFYALQVQHPEEVETTELYEFADTVEVHAQYGVLDDSDKFDEDVEEDEEDEDPEELDINDIVEYPLLSSGLCYIKTEPIDPEDVVEDAVELDTVATQASLSISVVVSPGTFVNHIGTSTSSVQENGDTMELDQLTPPSLRNNHICLSTEDSSGDDGSTSNKEKLLSTNCDVNGIEEEVEMSLKKDNKENSRLLSTKPRVIAGTGGDGEIIVENGNGDVPIMTTPDCVVDESTQKPSFLLPPKAWMDGWSHPHPTRTYPHPPSCP